MTLLKGITYRQLDQRVSGFFPKAVNIDSVSM